MRNSLKNLANLYVNIRGLKSKLDSLENIITEVDPSIMCLVETHLKETDQVDVGGYTLVFRNDSGGILVALKDTIKNIAIRIESSNEVGQTLWAKIDNGEKQSKDRDYICPTGVQNAK